MARPMSAMLPPAPRPLCDPPRATRTPARLVWRGGLQLPVNCRLFNQHAFLQATCIPTRRPETCEDTRLHPVVPSTLLSGPPVTMDVQGMRFSCEHWPVLYRTVPYCTACAASHGACMPLFVPPPLLRALARLQSARRAAHAQARWGGTLTRRTPRTRPDNGDTRRRTARPRARHAHGNEVYDWRVHSSAP